MLKLLFGLILMLILPASALAQTITEGYLPKGELLSGMLVGLNAEDTRYVEAIDSSSAENMLGVIVDSQTAPIVLKDENSLVYVSASGQVDVLVSDQNGSIKKGDYLSLSSIAGIAMKTSSADKLIIGRALNDFSASNAETVISRASVVLPNNQTKAVSIGKIQLTLAVGRNPLSQTTNLVPGVLQNAVDSIAGKSVAPWRVYTSVVFLGLTAFISGVIIYSSVRSSITAIGRNPLAKKAIYKGLIQSSSIAIVVLISGIVGVYLMLKL